MSERPIPSYIAPELAAAAAQIAEPKKRIEAWNRLTQAVLAIAEGYQLAINELTAERQRREEAEEALREWENGYSAGWFYQHPDERPTARHFATYPAAEEKAGEG
jgi:hypothetical protein